MDRHRSLYKGTTPPWKETYRQRCLDRLKNNRARLLERYRLVGGNNRESPPGSSAIVQEVMEEEWSALQAEDRRLPSLWGPQGFTEMSGIMTDWDELAVLEEIQQELLSKEKSLVEEYERNLQFELQYISSVVEGREEVQIICPVCGMNNLSSSSACISCQCGLYISTEKHSITLEGLQHLLEVRVSEHMEECLYTPVFSVTADSEASSNLMISCQVCDYLSVVL
ncbi:RPA-interacting protein isoform X2 [Oryzias latipes]|uniref:RPA interacting protein n=1 Tax=Oryzias latipes TaxID=8090 RepID=A0A3B3HMP8_ORYLA|nr:RPA-interacting protein isoform X2 [Oryzias latipes]